MPRYRMKWRHARWETSTFYTDADSEEAARAKFNTRDIERAFDYEPGGYVDFVKPETIIEPVCAPTRADEGPIAFPATIAARLNAAIRVRRAGERISAEEWIAVAREIGSVMIERFEGAHGERLCKLTFDDGSDVELVDRVDIRSRVNIRIG
jgi:hypothetical protein